MNHTLLLQIGLEGAPPTEFRLFKLGVNATSKGDFTLDGDGGAAVLAAFEAHGMDRMPIDFNHGMVKGGEPKAAGWAVLEMRADGLWAADVQWTPLAEQSLKDREYRFISPAFRFDEDKRIVEVVNVALTNLPATKQPLPLVAHDDAASDGTHSQAPDKGKEISPMSDKLFKLLGAADEGEALVIASEINTLSKSLLKATGASSLDDAIAAIEANAKLPAEVVTLSAKLKAYEDANLTRDRDALIESLSEDGKLPPALHDWAKGQSLESLTAFGQSAPVLSAPATPPGTTPADAPLTLSAEDEYAMAQFGIESDEDKEKWLAVRKDELAKKAKE